MTAREFIKHMKEKQQQQQLSSTQEQQQQMKTSVSHCKSEGIPATTKSVMLAILFYRYIVQQLNSNNNTIQLLWILP